MQTVYEKTVHLAHEARDCLLETLACLALGGC